MIVADYDHGKEGSFTDAEAADLKKGAFDNLRNYHYFLAFSVGGKPVALPPIKDFKPSIRDGKLVYSFSLPISPRGHAGRPRAQDHDLRRYLLRRVRQDEPGRRRHRVGGPRRDAGLHREDESQGGVAGSIHARPDRPQDEKEISHAQYPYEHLAPRAARVGRRGSQRRLRRSGIPQSLHIERRPRANGLAGRGRDRRPRAVPAFAHRSPRGARARNSRSEDTGADARPRARLPSVRYLPCPWSGPRQDHNLDVFPGEGGEIAAQPDGGLPHRPRARGLRLDYRPRPLLHREGSLLHGFRERQQDRPDAELRRHSLDRRRHARPENTRQGAQPRPTLRFR